MDIKNMNMKAIALAEKDFAPPPEEIAAAYGAVDALVEAADALALGKLLKEALFSAACKFNMMEAAQRCIFHLAGKCEDVVDQRDSMAALAIYLGGKRADKPMPNLARFVLRLEQEAPEEVSEAVRMMRAGKDMDPVPDNAAH